MKNQIYGFVRECNMPANDIVPMKESPFKVRNDKDMKNLVESNQCHAGPDITSYQQPNSI